MNEKNSQNLNENSRKKLQVWFALLALKSLLRESQSINTFSKTTF